jgi:hypothetical protein
MKTKARIPFVFTKARPHKDKSKYNRKHKHKQQHDR